jgi:hypothetical protein
MFLGVAPALSGALMLFAAHVVAPHAPAAPRPAPSCVPVQRYAIRCVEEWHAGRQNVIGYLTRPVTCRTFRAVRPGAACPEICDVDRKQCRNNP